MPFILKTSAFLSFAIVQCSKKLMQKINVMVSPDVIVKLSNLNAAVSDHINYGHTFCWQSHDLAHDGAPMMDSYAFMICGLMVRK